LGALLIGVAHAQNKTPTGKDSIPAKAPAATKPVSPPEPNAAAQLAAINGRLAAMEQALKPNSVDARLAVIEQLIREMKPSSPFTIALPWVIAFLGGLIGVVIGGFISQRLQGARLKQEAKIADDKAAHEKELATAQAQQDRDLSEKQAKLQIGTAVIDWELKQLSLLYGPLRALLGQSRALYGEMNRVLLKHTDLFRTTDGADGPEFQIQTSPGEWTRFRTVIHIFEVYGKGFGVETYFDEIVLIGAQMVKIIQQNAGYARAEEKELMVIFGKYLAHFAVLKSMHEAARAKLNPSSPDAGSGAATQSPAPEVNISAAFPDVIHVLINQGFEAITADIEHWRNRAAA
jgi:hypothetical protein